MKTYARIFDGKVQEIFQTDLDITQMFHADMIWVEITSMDPAPVFGWTAEEKDGSWAFSAPTPPVRSEEELKAEAISQRNYLLSVENEATAGMADAYIAGLLEPSDVEKFKAYAAYKLALNKITIQPGYPAVINWPKAPSFP